MSFRAIRFALGALGALALVPAAVAAPPADKDKPDKDKPGKPERVSYVATYPYAPASVPPTPEQGIADALEQEAAGEDGLFGTLATASFCKNDVVVNSNYGWFSVGGIDLRLQVYWCSNGSTVTTCYRHRWVERSDYWRFNGWIGWEAYGGPGTTRCGAWTQAYVSRTYPLWPDAHKYPWMRAIGYANGSYANDKGGL